MSSRFVDLAFVAGLPPDALPAHLKTTPVFKNNAPCAILQLTLVKTPNPEALKQRLAQGTGAKMLKWVRSLQLGGSQAMVSIFIKYSNPFKNTHSQAIKNIKLLQVKKGEHPETMKLEDGWEIVPLIKDKDIQSLDDLFSPSNSQPQQVNEVFVSQPEIDLYLTIQKTEVGNKEANPLNEIRLQEIQDPSASVRMPYGYRMAFSTMVASDEHPSYIIKRPRIDPKEFRYLPHGLDAYPFEHPTLKTEHMLKMVFPDGVSIHEVPKTPVCTSCYISLEEKELERYTLTFITFSEPLSEEFVQMYNLCNFRSYSSLYSDKVICLVSRYHDGVAAEKILNYLVDYLHTPCYPFPFERILCNIVDEVLVLNDRITNFVPLNLRKPQIEPSEDEPLDPRKEMLKSVNEPRPKPIQITISSKITNLSVFSLKTLFRVLKIDSIVQVFCNLLLERSLYFVAQSNRVGFDVIESLTALLYPLTWELPKILSYECNYCLFDSPFPLLYFINTRHFQKEKLQGKDLSGKTLVFLDLDEISELGATPSDKIFSHKPLSSLKKKLHRLVGTYNEDYLNKKASMPSSDFQNLLLKEEDTTPFDFWKVRGTFFEFVADFLSDYTGCYKECKILTSQLGSDEVFDSQKYIKTKNSLKNKEFGQSFIKTNLFSHFIESRISPESEAQKRYFNTFDAFLKLKNEGERIDAMGEEFKSMFEKTPLLTIDPNFEDLTPPPKVLGYGGTVPQFRLDLMSKPRVFPRRFEPMTFEACYEFMNQSLSPKKLDEEKWARQNLELLYSVWFMMMRIFLTQCHQPVAVKLVGFAFNKLSQLENEKIKVNIDIIKNMAFMLGVFKEVSKFQKLLKKYHKPIGENNQLLAVYAEFVQGSAIKPLALDPSLKAVKYGDLSSRKNEYSESELDQIDLQSQNDEKRDAMIPVSVRSYFECNAFCQSCSTYIPEEIIFGKMDRGTSKTMATCPNQACRFVYEPVFKVIFLKEKGSTKMSEGIKLQSPIKLWLLVKEFLETHPAKELLTQEAAGDIYWNLVFYTNLLNVPGFFSEDMKLPKILEYTLSNLQVYRCCDAAKKDNQNDSTGTGFGEFSSMSPDKHNHSGMGKGPGSGGTHSSTSQGFSIHLNNSMQGFSRPSPRSSDSKVNSSSLSPSGSQSNLPPPKFEVKKDFYKRLEGYEDKIKKSTPLGVLKIYFQYCEDMRNFERKYDMFRSYVGLLTL